MEKLFLAIYFNDLEKIKEIKHQYPDVYANLRCFLVDGDKAFDLINLTIFNQIIWFTNSWRAGLMPFVERNRQKVNELMSFWRSEFENHEIGKNVEYNEYFDYFYI